MQNESRLFIEEIPMIRGSFRAVTQSIKPRPMGGLKMTANGTLKNRNRPSLRKYDTSISFSDLRAPALDRIFEGDLLTIHCVYELSGDAGQAFGRPHVPGSVIWWNADHNIVPSLTDETVPPVGAVSYTYCPILITRMESWDGDSDEYGALVSGTLNLKEA